MEKKNKEFICFCKRKINYSEQDNLVEHLNTCTLYQQESPFNQEFRKLDLNKLMEVHLVAIRCELLGYIQRIDQDLMRTGYVGNSSMSSNSSTSQRILQPSGDLSSSMNMSSRISYKAPIPNKLKGDNLICHACEREMDSIMDMQSIWYLNKCLHTYCRGCLIKYINQEYVNENGNLPCKLCAVPLAQEDLRKLLGEHNFELLNQKLIQKQYNIVTCMQCQDKFEFMPGNPSSIKDATGKALSKELEKHYASNRFTCTKCQTEQCKGCQSAPYHMGYDCENFKQFQNAIHCRFCNTQVDSINPNLPFALQLVCDDPQCKDKAQNACLKINQCSHPCNGYRDEINCPPCLHEGCCENDPDLNGQTGGDFCNICFVEDLNSAPIIVPSCGHIFHYHCLAKRLEIQWTSSRIIFNFCLCPLCQTWLEFPVDSQLQSDMNKNMILFEDIKRRSLERLQYEGLDQSDRITNPQSAFYNKPLDFAMGTYAYYQCFQCKKPYFGGAKQCGQVLEEDKRDFDPQELVCPTCCDVPSENCKKHGSDFIEFKCQFCCTIAQWYCWGNTHFCESCHSRQCQGDYVSKYTQDQLPKCNGKDFCPLKINHKPNGEECALGCSLCRNHQQNNKNF